MTNKTGTEICTLTEQEYEKFKGKLSRKENVIKYLKLIRHIKTIWLKGGVLERYQGDYLEEVGLETTEEFTKASSYLCLIIGSILIGTGHYGSVSATSISKILGVSVKTVSWIYATWDFLISPTRITYAHIKKKGCIGPSPLSAIMITHEYLKRNEKVMDFYEKITSTKPPSSLDIPLKTNY